MRNGMKWIPLMLMLMSAVASGQICDGTLLQNCDFTDPPIAGAAPGVCGPQDEGPIDAWSESGAVERNKGLCGPNEGFCPPTDGTYLDITQNGMAYQVIPNQLLAPSTNYKVTGLWQLWNVIDNGSTTSTIEIRRGSNPDGGTVLASVQETLSRPPDDTCNNDSWPSFCFGFATPPTLGADPLVVVIKTQSPSCCYYGLRVDWIKVEEGSPSCHNVTGITPEYGVRGDVINASITGGGFLEPSLTSTKLIQGLSEINGTITDMTTSTIDADFDLTGAAPGDYNLVVTVDGADATLLEAFVVILDTLSNGSFDDDNVGECTPSPMLPTDWLAVEGGEWGWGRRLVLNGFYEDGGVQEPLPILPTCPQDGPNYANMGTDKNSSNAYSYAFQTIAAMPGSEYTFSGLFAVAGDLQVSLDIMDGMPDFSDTPGGLIGREIINAGDAVFDWRFARISATPSLDHMTVMWRSDDLGSIEQIKAAFADGLAVEVCEGVPPTITAGTITPNMGVNDDVVNITNISGTGFVGEPVVLLSRPGAAITATDVDVVSANKLTCQFDLTGQPTGWYDLIVKQGGCIAEQPEQFLVVGAEFVNGSFEDPTAPQDCGPPPTIVPGVPTGWSYEGELIRDHNVFPPTCPNPIDGGHYGSMTGPGGATRRSYQVVQVQPTLAYRFSGSFSHSSTGGDATVRIALVDGTIQGGVIDPADVVAEAILPPGDWQPAEILGAATSTVMTVVWEVQNSGSTFGSHADGLKLVPEGVACNDLFADSDNDGDVDHEDFGLLQKCITGPDGDIPNEGDLEYCRCFDRNFDTDITQSDVTAFEACASGPTVPADPACAD